MKKQYWTIVVSKTLKPVPPLDSFDSGDCDECAGIMVFCTKEDAEASMKHQIDLYYCDEDPDYLKVVPLGEERCCK